MPRDLVTSTATDRILRLLLAAGLALMAVATLAPAAMVMEFASSAFRV